MCTHSHSYFTYSSAPFFNRSTPVISNSFLPLLLSSPFSASSSSPSSSSSSPFTSSRAEVKLQQAVEEIEKLLVPAPEGEDDLKKRQLMELAIINGTYRDNSTKTAAALTAAACNPRIIASPMTLPQVSVWQAVDGMDEIGRRIDDEIIPP